MFAKSILDRACEETVVEVTGVGRVWGVDNFQAILSVVLVHTPSSFE
jgi:hypothetical protein